MTCNRKQPGTLRQHPAACHRAKPGPPLFD